MDHILGGYGTFIVERAGTEVDTALDGLGQWRDNIYIIRQLIQNDVSSTKIRLFLKRGMSVLYLLPACVISYILDNGLYVDESNHEANEAQKRAVQQTLGNGEGSATKSYLLRG